MEIIKGVYIQTVENKKVVQKYVPTEKLELANGVNLGEFLNGQTERIEGLNSDLESLARTVTQLKSALAEYQKATATAIEQVIDHVEKDKFL